MFMWHSQPSGVTRLRKPIFIMAYWEKNSILSWIHVVYGDNLWQVESDRSFILALALLRTLCWLPWSRHNRSGSITNHSHTELLFCSVFVEPGFGKPAFDVKLPRVKEKKMYSGGWAIPGNKILFFIYKLVILPAKKKKNPLPTKRAIRHTNPPFYVVTTILPVSGSRS